MCYLGSFKSWGFPYYYLLLPTTTYYYLLLPTTTYYYLLLRCSGLVGLEHIKEFRGAERLMLWNRSEVL